MTGCFLETRGIGAVKQREENIQFLVMLNLSPDSRDFFDEQFIKISDRRRIWAKIHKCFNYTFLFNYTNDL